MRPYFKLEDRHLYEIIVIGLLIFYYSYYYLLVYKNERGLLILLIGGLLFIFLFPLLLISLIYGEIIKTGLDVHDLENIVLIFITYHLAIGLILNLLKMISVNNVLFMHGMCYVFFMISYIFIKYVKKIRKSIKPLKG